MSWEDAATITLAGNTALFFIRDLENNQAGHKILINGASGAVSNATDFNNKRKRVKGGGAVPTVATLEFLKELFEAGKLPSGRDR